MKFVLTGLSLPLDATPDMMFSRIAREIRTTPTLFSYKVLRRSLDCRKGQVSYVYSVVIDSERFISSRNLKPYKEPAKVVIGRYAFVDRPVVVGFGPAGMYAALVLARSGAHPIIIERGKKVEERAKDVEALRQKGILNPESNVCYGEGGAGAFSDGKLATGVNDERTSFILHEFVNHGAKEDILTDSLPHIGSDYLQGIVRSFREEIIGLGGEFLFESRFIGFKAPKGEVEEAIYKDKEGIEHSLPTSHIILAIGHSPLETMKDLLDLGVKMEPKAFSVGVRIEHKQSEINKYAYHDKWNNPNLGAAPYKGVVHLPSGRSVYTFCMCPGGYVFNSSTEENTVLTNGMSNNAREGENGNSALLVNVEPKDYYSSSPLDGFYFRQMIERKAFCKDKPYFAPVERTGDFLVHSSSLSLGGIVPSYKPGVYLSSLYDYLPSFVSSSLRDGLIELASHLSFFRNPDGIMTGFETRSSSPVRIPRGENCSSAIMGLYPCGEGASYAGGITSAALDGLKVSLSFLK